MGERIILHSDLNNFYASVELLERPRLRAFPVAVCGSAELRHGIVLAKNELAKRAGVRTGMAIWQARERCANLRVLEPHMPRYIEYSRRARDIYRDYTEFIEPFGIDECWLDITRAAPDFESGARLAEEIRARIKTELGVTVSIGVSFNKVLAKLGSDYKKPDAVTVFTREDFRALVWPLAVEELLYVGRATSRKLRSMGINTIGQLAAADPAVLRLKLGKMGELISSYARDADSSGVMRDNESDPVKSVGNSTTTPRDIACDADAKKVIYALADSVGTRRREGGFRA
ncbi:MAG: DNA polymerase IV, partial [Oscillospiraceae bacterium]|nr:DNA polymerase IV [Oscillospiraceae bacterium]